MKHHRNAQPAFGCLAFALVVAATADAARAAGPVVPVALVWGPGDVLHTALRDGRQVVAVDSRSWSVVARWDLPISPASLGGSPRQRTANACLAGSTVTSSRVGRWGRGRPDLKPS